MLRYTVTGTVLLLALGAANAALALTPVEQAEMLAAHNRWRQQAGVPEVQWSAALAANAQSWADNLKQQSCRMRHSAVRGTGENLYWASPIRYSTGAVAPQPVTPTQVTNAWGGEEKFFDYATNTCAAGQMCGHYTQVMWRTTTQIGCARAVCSDHSQVWVCHYTPPGNWRGQKPF